MNNSNMEQKCQQSEARLRRAERWLDMFEKHPNACKELCYGMGTILGLGIMACCIVKQGGSINIGSGGHTVSICGK